MKEFLTHFSKRASTYMAMASFSFAFILFMTVFKASIGDKKVPAELK